MDGDFPPAPLPPSSGSKVEEEVVSSVPVIDLNAQLAAASSSLWGFLATASTQLKATTVSVVSEVKKDFADFKAAFNEENKEIFQSVAETVQGNTNEANAESNTNAVQPPSSSSSPSFSSSSFSTFSSSITSSTISSASPLPSTTSSSLTDSTSSLPASGNEADASVDSTAAAAGSNTSTQQDWGSSVLDNVERIGDRVLTKAINLIPSSIWNFSDSENPQETQTKQTGSKLKGEDTVYAPTSVKSAKLASMESNYLSYTTDPCEDANLLPSTPGANLARPSEEYKAFFHHFHVDYDEHWSNEIEHTIKPRMTTTLHDMYHKLVQLDPEQKFSSTFKVARIPEKLFWCRYLFRKRRIEEEELRRSKLLDKLAATSSPVASSPHKSPATSNATNPAATAIPPPADAIFDDSFGWGEENEEEAQRPSLQTEAAPLVAATSRKEPVPAPAPKPPTVPVAAPLPTASASTSTPASTPASSTPSVADSTLTMRQRLEAESRARVAKRLAGKAAAAGAASSDAVSSSSSSSASSSSTRQHDSTTAVDPTFSQVIQQLQKQQEPVTSSAVPPALFPAPIPAAPLATAAASHTSPHQQQSGQRASVSASPALSSDPVIVGPPDASASPALSASSRSSSGSGIGWVDVDEANVATAASSSTTKPAVQQPQVQRPNVTAASKPSGADATANDDWDTWE